MKKSEYKNVFEALEGDKTVAENLKIRAELMHALRSFVKSEGLTQIDAARLFNVSQPRISDLVTGKIDKFTIDMLITMLSSIGKHVDIRITSEAA